MKQIKIKPRRIKRGKVALGEFQKQTKENQNKLEEILEDLNISREAFVRRAWKRCYHYQLTYYKIFKKWRNNPEYKRLPAWFKRQPLYPTEINSIVNMMFVLEQRFGLDLVRDNILQKAIFLSFMLENDLSDRTLELYKRNGFTVPKGYNRKKAQKEMLARGFIHINDFEDYKPGYNYVVSNIGNREYYYPLRCFYNYDHCLDEGLLSAHVLQGLVGVPGYTAVNYWIDKKYKPKNKQDVTQSRRKKSRR